MKRIVIKTILGIACFIIILVAWGVYYDSTRPQYQEHDGSLTYKNVILTPIAPPDNAPTSSFFWKIIGYDHGTILFRFAHNGTKYVGESVEMGPTLYYIYSKN